jgi:hypothetical protein
VTGKAVLYSSKNRHDTSLWTRLNTATYTVHVLEFRKIFGNNKFAYGSSCVPINWIKVLPWIFSILEQMLSWCPKFNVALLASYAALPVHLSCCRDDKKNNSTCQRIWPGIISKLTARFIGDLIQNIQGHHEIYPLLLPICTVATAVKAMCKCCGRIFVCDSNPPPQSFFNYTRKI